MLHRDALYAHLHDEAFGLGGRPNPAPQRIGVEAELIPVSSESGEPLPVIGPDGGGTLPFLRRFGGRAGWQERATPHGAPCFRLPSGGILWFEPGGQIELSTPPDRSAAVVIAALRGTLPPLVREAREEGIRMLPVGIAPRGAVERVPLQLHGERYARMTRFLRAIGTGGERMMRQTAAFQVSLDGGPAPVARWRLLNAMAPHVVAVFAASPVYRGATTGHRSYRARVWRELDGGRTGLFAGGADAVAEYLDFALRAPAMLLGPPDGPHEPFGCWLERGAAEAWDWRAHLSTLFPEVRPRGFFEVRSADAVSPGACAAPVVFLAGCAYAPRAAEEALEAAGPPDAARLETAGRVALADPRMASAARDLAEIALRGARSLGPAVFSARDIEEAEAFFHQYTFAGRSPADDRPLPYDRFAPPAAAPLSAAG